MLAVRLDQAFIDLRPEIHDVIQQISLNVAMSGFIQLLQYLADVDLRIDRLLFWAEGPMTTESDAVIILLGGRIADHTIGLTDLLKASFGLLVAGMVVRMVLLGKAPECRLDLKDSSILLNPKDSVVIFQ